MRTCVRTYMSDTAAVSDCLLNPKDRLFAWLHSIACSALLVLVGQYLLHFCTVAWNSKHRHAKSVCVIHSDEYLQARC